MKKIAIKDTPAGAENYQLEDGRIFRIYLDLKTPVAQLATAESIDVETRGYQIDKSGAFMVDDNQEPIFLQPSRSRIPMANIRSGTDTAKPGWVQQVVLEGDELAEEDMKSVRKLKNLPKTGEPGDRVVVGDELYAWSDGVYDSIRRARLTNLPQEKADTPLDDATVESLIP